MKRVAFVLVCVSLFWGVSCSKNSEPPQSTTAQAQKTIEPSTPPEAPPAVVQSEPSAPQTVAQQTTAPQTETVPPPAAQEHHHEMKQTPAKEAEPAAEAPKQATYRVPPYFENPDAAGELPPTIDPDTVPVEAAPAYRVARENPKLLAQLPCFCYCDRFGHTSLHSCYVDDHAKNCDVCMHETLDAYQMSQKGMTIQEIRAAIIGKYHQGGME